MDDIFEYMKCSKCKRKEADFIIEALGICLDCESKKIEKLKNKYNKICRKTK